MHRISPDFRLSDYHYEVGNLWRSRDDEPETQEFAKLPPWMHYEEIDIETRLDLQKAIPEALDTICPRERKIILLRFWFDMTLDECGDVFELTRERIRQIEAHALRKLRHPSRSKILYMLFDSRQVTRKVEEEDWTWMESMLVRIKQRQEDDLLKQLMELKAN